MQLFRSRSILIFAMLMLAILPLFPSQTLHAQELESQADQYIEILEKNDEFTGVAFLAKGDSVLYNKAFGKAVHEWDIPNSPDTRFCLASVSKQLTAAAILILQQEGKLTVNSTLSDFYPSYPNGENITIHQLLTHTAGIPNHTSFEDWAQVSKLPFEMDSLLQKLYDREADFEPGSQYAYSNSGYALLGDIIEKVSGMDYETFLKSSIFEPLGMDNSGTISANSMIPKIAYGYDATSKGYQPAELIDLSHGFGAGHIYSTVDDLYKWDRAIRSNKILTEKSKEAMYTPEKQNYAYGWGVYEYEGIKAYGHSGGINGYATFFLRLPEENIVAIVLCNSMSSKAAETAQTLGKLALGKEIEMPEIYQTIEVTEAELEHYTGQYSLNPAFVLTVKLKDGSLWVDLTGQPAIEVYPEDEDTFFYKVVKAKLVFEKGEDHAASVTLFQNGQELTFTRME